MTANETRGLGVRRCEGWMRRSMRWALALYLTPAVLVVLLIGAVGLVCCAVVRLAVGDLGRRGDARLRRHGLARTIRAPHVRTASRSRSPSR